MPRWVHAALVLVAVCLGAGCNKKSSIAELKKADGPVEREEGTGPWTAAPIGTKFYIGDAARTADGGAQLELAGSAKIAMQPHTVLRFGGKGSTAKIAVELGAIDLSGTGSFGLDVGDVKLDNGGSIRITAKGQGKSSIELLVGAATVSGLDGKTVDLEIGKVLDLGFGPIVVTASADAGVDGALADAAIDAPPVADTGDAQIEVTGKKAEVLAPGETKWAPLPAGAGSIAKGTKLRLGAGTTAKLVAKGTTLALAGGSRMTVGDDLLFGLEVGTGTATVPDKTEGKVGVPGGSVVLDAQPNGTEARIDVGPKGDAKVTVSKGSAKLVGANDDSLAMARGESASLAKAGKIHPDVVIPTYFDMRTTVGDAPNFTIHDPKGSTAVQFFFNGKCNGGVIELDHDNRFRTPRISGGKDSANMLVQGGSWAYRLRCDTGGGPGAAVASGRIVVSRDSGTRPLPKTPPVNPIDADGRNYRISYQSLIPDIKIKYGGGGGAFKLHLATGGAEETFEASKPTFTVPGKQLKEATYTYWVDHDGVKQDKVSTLIINFDQTAPQVYIESPSNGAPFGVEIEVKGAVLPGWTAKVDVVEIPVDKNTRRFAAKVPPPSGGAVSLAIRLSHPQRGVHYYLRRGAK